MCYGWGRLSPSRTGGQGALVQFVDQCGINFEIFRKRYMAADDPEPQLIAEAIAAFYENNRRRKQVGQPTIRSKVFPGITMTGTAPTFYKIPVTEHLLYAITTAQYPAQETIVHKLIPPILNIARFAQEGMLPLTNRRVILRCFEAFKQFLC
jgi:hypothetical protein